MTLNLDKRQINNLLDREEFKINISDTELFNLFTKTYERTIKIFNEIQNNEDKNFLELSNVGEDINPILWQCGHIIYFYKDHCANFFDLKNCEDEKKELEFYDSFKTKSKFRINKNKLVNLYVLKDDFEILYKNIKLKTNLNHKAKYVLLLCILHNEMHIEALIFSCLHLNYKLNNFISVGLYSLSLRGKSKLLKVKPKFVKINSGSYIQGSKVSSNYLSFDNERPVFRKFIDTFYMSDTPITEYQYLQFILNDGYKIKDYWENESWNWIKKNKIDCPLYWSLDTKHLELRKSNYPICNISWYEAKAYCKWAGFRLPTESEWEYVASYYGKCKYPWGNNMEAKYCNLNYRVNRPLEVDDGRLKCEISPLKIKQLIGNVWEWCEEPIYPYEGFNIDPIYREMSYPFFGFKKICRGGCFAVPDNLIHSRYRNAQMPDCRIQFIGFRVCRNEKEIVNLKKVRKQRREYMGLCTDL